MEKIENLLKNNWKRYLISSLITFVSGFAIAVIPLLDELSMTDVQNGALVGIAFIGIRAGLKLVFEGIRFWYLNVWLKRIDKKTK